MKEELKRVVWVYIAIAMVLFIMVVNLRGVKESGTAFAFPTYFFLIAMTITLIIGIVRLIAGTLGTVVDPPHIEMIHALQPITLFLIIFLLYLNTRSFAKTFIVLLAVPFSALGAIWFLFLLGYNMSIGVWVGLIALLGVDAETGVFMLLYLDLAYDQAKREGRLNSLKDLQEVIRYGAVRRLRPKFMTVATMFLGLIPILPQPKVADGAIAALKEAGLNTDGLHPKDIDAVMNEDIDLVVTVCDNAREACPIFPKPIPAIHLPFHDPHGEPLESFLAVRDDIRTRLIPAVRETLGL